MYPQSTYDFVPTDVNYVNQAPQIVEKTAKSREDREYEEKTLHLAEKTQSRYYYNSWFRDNLFQICLISLYVIFLVLISAFLFVGNWTLTVLLFLFMILHSFGLWLDEKCNPFMFSYDKKRDELLFLIRPLFIVPIFINAIRLMKKWKRQKNYERECLEKGIPIVPRAPW